MVELNLVLTVIGSSFYKLFVLSLFISNSYVPSISYLVHPQNYSCTPQIICAPPKLLVHPPNFSYPPKFLMHPPNFSHTRYDFCPLIFFLSPPHFYPKPFCCGNGFRDMHSKTIKCIRWFWSTTL